MISMSKVEERSFDAIKIITITSVVMNKIKFLILFFYYRILIKNFLRIFVGVQFSNSDNLRKSKQYILVGNHNSHIDTMAIMAALPSSMLQKVHPIAAADYFGKHKVARFLMKYVINARLIHRKKRDGSHFKNPIEQMDALLKSGESIIIFPEGTRGDPGIMQDFKKGVAILLKNNPEITYVPIFMKGFEKALPKGDGFLVPHNSEIIFGDPTKIRSDDLSNILDQIFVDISKLGER